MNRRPRPGEGEEDILKMQEEFLREKLTNKDLKPAAQLVDARSTSAGISTGSKRSSDGNPRKPSKYAQAKSLANITQKRPRNEPTGSLMGDIIEKNIAEPFAAVKEHTQDDNVYFPQVIPRVLGNIVEKNVDNHVYQCETVHALTSKGFPEVQKFDLKTAEESNMSLFAQQIKLEKNKQSDMLTDKALKAVNKFDAMDVEPKSAVNVPEKSFIISQDADSIHQQNVEILKNMKENEILEEQKKLVASLDPKLLKFLKSRREKPAEKMDTDETFHRNVPDSSAIKTSSDELSDTLWDNDVLSHPQVDKWVHFDSLEKDKLEWMKGIEESKKHNGDEPYEARFDFKGYLLPHTIEYNEKTKVLFHHGDEAHRPGYSLIELFELSRSTIIQQRVVALNTIAGILEYYSTGIYKNVIDIPITKVFFIIRFAMDENKVAILEPALRAMRNLIYNRVDEACLDALLGTEEGLQQPGLEHDKSELTELESKESELKDFHLADIDLITGALRTDIIQRISYILNTVKPTFNCVQYCLQILTRLARDSEELALNIVTDEHLINCIIHSFLPVTSINFHFNSNIVYNGKPVLAAVKFIRVLSLQSGVAAQLLLTKYNILGPMSAYVGSGVDGTYGLKIQIEALSALTNLLSYDIGAGDILALNPVLITSLYKHVNGTEINLNSSIVSVTHAAVLIQLLIKLLPKCGHEMRVQIYPLIKQGVMKWLSQMCSSEYCSCGHLKLLCATLDCVRTIITIEQSPVTDTSFEGVLKTFASSAGFSVILKQLITSSNLLSGIDGNIHLTKNLSSVGGSVTDKEQKVLPVLSFASPMLLLSSLMKLLDSLNDASISVHFVSQLWCYLDKIRTELPSLCDNWFTRVETNFIFYLLKIITNISDITETEKDIVYAVSNKMCYVLRGDKLEELIYLFQNIVFNKHWFTAERLLNLMSVQEANIFSRILSSIEEIRLCYIKVLNTSLVKTGPSIVLRIWQEPILPRDWIYLPIVKLYTVNQEDENTPKVHGIHAKKVAAAKEAEKEFILSCCLEWILFNELCFVNLLKDIDLTDRFCRLMCVFLCDNSLFLEKHIQLLIEKCFDVIFIKEKKQQFNFDKTLTGIHNFQDFYTQLLEQFQAVSYGDTNFAVCVLVPLAQKHNVKWRKLVWSEYAGCLRALDCPIEKLCYDINDYLYPEETDESLLESYFNALSKNLVRPNTVTYKIASHHFNYYKAIKLRTAQS